MQNYLQKSEMEQLHAALNVANGQKAKLAQELSDTQDELKKYREDLNAANEKISGLTEFLINLRSQVLNTYADYPGNFWKI